MERVQPTTPSGVDDRPPLLRGPDYRAAPSAGG